ncbi:MAG: hypothetical protein ACTSU7_00040 [Candidatus Heimdallarchaeaceae archaeon]
MTKSTKMNEANYLIQCAICFKCFGISKNEIEEPILCLDCAVLEQRKTAKPQNEERSKDD